MAAYQDALQQTSRKYAPWYAIPADDKKFMRRTVADILVRTLESMDLKMPEATKQQKADMKTALRELEREKS